MKSIDFTKYEGMASAGKFFHTEKIKYNQYYFNDEPAGVLYAASFILSNSIGIQIFVKEFKFLKKQNLKRSWEIKNFLKEKIYRIRVTYNNDCIKGCDFDILPNSPKLN